MSSRKTNALHVLIDRYWQGVIRLCSMRRHMENRASKQTQLNLPCAGLLTRNTVFAVEPLKFFNLPDPTSLNEHVPEYRQYRVFGSIQSCAFLSFAHPCHIFSLIRFAVCNLIFPVRTLHSEHAEPREWVMYHPAVGQSSSPFTSSSWRFPPSR